MSETIPKHILEKYPQLPIVFEALQQYRSGQEITAKCPKCKTVVVAEIEDVGVSEVNCKCGFLHYGEKYAGV